MEAEEASNGFLSPTISHINDEENYDEKAELEALVRVVGDTRAKAIRLSSLSLLEHITNDFSDENILGTGGSAAVYLGVLPDGSRIAIKRLHGMLDEDGSRIYRNEVSTMMRFAHHKNIARLIGYCYHIQEELLEYVGEIITAQNIQRLICIEYVPNGTLDEHIFEEFPRGLLDWNQRYHIFKGICQGLHHLHDEVHIVHGDIKPSNILLDDNLVPKIFDFGLSRHFVSEGESSIVTDKMIGTLRYVAPELIYSGHSSIKSDIFSFGVTIMQLLFGHDFYRSFRDELSVEKVLNQLRKILVKQGEFSLWENKYQQLRTCLEICCNCMDIDPDKRPTAFEIIQVLHETESTNYSGGSGNAPPLWQSGDESDLSDTDTIEQEPEPESTVEFPPSEEELTDLDTNGETSNQAHDKLDTVSKLLSDELSKLNVLEKITDDFSHKRIVGKDGTFRGSHKAFVYKGEIPRQKMIAVKRLIGVEIPAEKFKREAEQFMSLDHKNIVKVAGYCHDESRGQKLVQFKGKPLPQIFNGPEQVLCYEYVHNGSLREYLTGQGSREIDWHTRYRLIKGTCEGLQYLHKGRKDFPIIHLNLNPSSVLLDENNVPRITGFDFSKLIGENRTKSVVLKMNGPVAYLPPDFFHFKGTDLTYLATVDIYSLGLMILEITTRQEIKGDHGKLTKTIEENWREESQIASLYTSLEPDKLWQVKLCIDIGLDCVKSKPEKRPTARDIMVWLDKGSKPVPAPRLGAGRVPRPPVRTNITQADDHIQEKAKRTGFLKLFGRK